jgi:hypothetical protein
MRRFPKSTLPIRCIVGPRTLPRYHDPVAALPVVSAALDVVYLAGLLLFRGCGLRLMLLLLLF